MILKLIIDFYRWLWGMEPLVVKTPLDEPTGLALLFGAIIDIGIIIGIIGLVIMTYNDKKRGGK